MSIIPHLYTHRLLLAREWQDRPEFDEVCNWWLAGGHGVCALIGIGGAGKTAIADRFLLLCCRIAMKVIQLENESRPLAELLGLARTEPLVFTRKGRPVAALLDVASDDLETLSLRTNAEFQAYLQQCRDRHQREGGTSLEQVRARYGLPSRAAVQRGRQTKQAKKNDR